MLVNNKLSPKFRKIIILTIFVIAFIYVPLGSNFLFQGDKDQKSSVDYLNLKLSAQEINVTTPENKTYFNPMSGYYPGTYGFENDIIGENPMDWTTLEGTCSVDIISALGNHNKVIEFYDDSTGGQKAEMRNNFTTPQVSGTIEFWIRFGSGADMRLDLFDAERDSDALLIRWGRSGSTNIEFYNDTYNLISTYSVNTWHHYRIQFDCTDDWHLWIDGVSQDNDIGYTYRNSPMNFTQFDLESHDTHENYYSYMDAIGYSWDPNYNVGDNLNEGLLLSYENSTTLDWQGFSLDGQTNKTILGNFTLPMPSPGHHTIQVFGNNSIGEIFESEPTHFSVKAFNIKTPENKTYTGPMNGYYPASYGFENVNNGDLPIVNALANWSDYSPYANCRAEVVSEYLGHKKVLHIDDDNSAGKAYVRINTTNDITSGTLEYWVLFESAAAAFILRTMDYDLSEYRFNFGIESGKWVYYFGGGWNNIPSYDGTYDPISNTWYHISLSFRCEGAPVYNGLGENRFYVEIDDIPSGELEFRTNGVDMEYIYFDSQSATTTDTWVDAFSLSWDPNYNLGDNLDEGILLSYDKAFSADWMGYSLDDQANQTILGNTTIPIPSNGYHTIQVFGNNSIGEMFESDKIYFTIEHISIDIITPENITYTEPMIGYFPATYGFENDIPGGYPTDWTVDEAGGTVNVITVEDGHKSVLEMDDTSATLSTEFYQNFTEQVTGTIEFWAKFSDTSTDRAYTLRINDEGTAHGIYMTVANGKLRRHPTTPAIDICDLNSDQWYHLRIEFDCSTNWHLWVDDVSQDGGSGYSFWETPVALDQIHFYTPSIADNKKIFIDAFGYSWDPNYNIGNNLYEGLLLSYTNSSALVWMGYSLDGQANKTILGNTTIPLPIVGHHTIQVSGNSLLGFYYESDIRHFFITIEDIIIDLLTPENIIYTNPMSGYYPGTYGFEEESVGTTGLGIGFLDTYEASTNCYITITSELDAHKNILRVYDNNVGLGLRTQFFNYFGNKGSGSIEFWIRTTDATLASHVRVYSSTDEYMIQFKIEDDRIQTNHIASWVDLIDPAANNQWYHIRFDLESTTGGYQGLNQYEYYVYVDGVRYGAFGFQNNVIPYKLFIGSLGTDGGYSSYYDAISYSWDADYDIGDNMNEGLLISYTNSSALEWIGYSLDGQANKTVTGNKVIPMPGNGAHTMQIHGTSAIGHHYSSDLVYFTVDISVAPPPPNGDNFMLIFILIGVFSILGVTIAIVVYKKVHTPSKEPKPRKPKVKKVKTKKKGIIEEEVFCPFCQTPITSEHKFCTYCGSDLNEEEEPKN